MVNCQTISHPVRNLEGQDINAVCERLTWGCFLVVMPRTNGGVDEASEEEEEADKQYDPDHATVKSVSFA